MKAVVTADGSVVGSGRGAGGWAAVVERGSDGWVERGRETNATSTRMELRAVIGGLRSLPDGDEVRVLSDAVLVQSVFKAWTARLLPGPRSHRSDLDLWAELAAEFDRFAGVEVEWTRSSENRTHRRAHLLAREEARALALSRAA